MIIGEVSLVGNQVQVVGFGGEAWVLWNEVPPDDDLGYEHKYEVLLPEEWVKP